MYLQGLGHPHPDTEISNAFFEEFDIETIDDPFLESARLERQQCVRAADVTPVGVSGGLGVLSFLARFAA